MMILLISFKLQIAWANPELFEAIKDNDVKKIEELIKNGADLNKVTNTPIESDGTDSQRRVTGDAIVIAAAYGHTEVIQLLIENGSNPNGNSHDDSSTDRPSHTALPLHTATRFGHLEAVQTLIKLGADPLMHSNDSSEELALHVAAAGGFLDIVKYLLHLNPETINHRSNPSEPIYSQTPLLAAFQNLRDDKSGVYRFLLSQGADPNVKENIDNRTPLHLACGLSGGDSTIVQQFLNTPVSITS